MFKVPPKSKSLFEEHQKYLKAIDSEFYEEARNAVLDKWLTLAKKSFLDGAMDWRLNFLAARLNRKESVFVKYKICMLKEAQFNMTKFTEPNGLITKNYSKLG